MENAKFTPGPWGYGSPGPRFIGLIRTQWEVGVPNGRGTALAFCDTEANARLIAAAPDMYEALMLLLANDLPVEDEEWKAQAKGRELGLAALAKAVQL